MRCNDDLLAAYGVPGTVMTEYSAAALSDPARVEELFDYCQILQGVISGRGWQTLLMKHGLDGLLAIDRRSGWLDAEEDAAADAVKYQCLIAGYDPEYDAFGRYDEPSGVFTDQDGKAREVVWGLAWQPTVQRTA